MNRGNLSGLGAKMVGKNIKKMETYENHLKQRKSIKSYTITWIHVQVKSQPCKNSEKTDKNLIKTYKIT